MTIRGEASGTKETFVFTIDPHPAGGYIIYIEFSGDGESGMTGAGIWPSPEKAKSIAEYIAFRRLNGARVRWQNDLQP